MLNNKPTMTGDDDTGRGPMTEHTTCPQPHEQLLVGWIMSGPMTTMTTIEGVDARHGEKTDDKPHHPPPASRVTAHGVDRRWTGVGRKEER